MAVLGIKASKNRPCSALAWPLGLGSSSQAASWRLSMLAVVQASLSSAWSGDLIIDHPSTQHRTDRHTAQDRIRDLGTSRSPQHQTDGWYASGISCFCPSLSVPVCLYLESSGRRRPSYPSGHPGLSSPSDHLCFWLVMPLVSYLSRHVLCSSPSVLSVWTLWHLRVASSIIYSYTLLLAVTRGCGSSPRQQSVLGHLRPRGF